MGKIGDITLTKQTGTTLLLNTAGKYVDSNVSFDIDVQTGVGSVTAASTNVVVDSDSSGRNISGVIGNVEAAAPVSGYYLKLEAIGTGACTITSAGWIAEGTLGTATATGIYYYPVSAGTAVLTGTNTITPSASVTGTNATLSNVDNGISVTSTGGGTASITAVATGYTPGYIGSGVQIGSETFATSSTTTTASSYISGVTLLAPASGTRSFTITVPNGTTSLITFTFTVDAESNVVVT